MTNNDILRRLRYTFNFNDNKVMALFASGGKVVDRPQISDWMKKDDDPAYKECIDVDLAAFLNGFINDRRGKKPGPQPKPELKLNNNLIFLKLKIALKLKDDDILAILKLAGLVIGKAELSAFFRSFEHKNRRHCKDQVLRNFLHGLQIKYYSDKAATPTKTLTKAPTKTFKWADISGADNSSSNQKKSSAPNRPSQSQKKKPW